MPIDARGVQARDGGSRPAFASGDLPRWFAVGLNSALAIVAGFGLVGLAGAVFGVFVPALVVPLGGVASLVLARWGRSGTGSGSHAPVAHMPSVGAAALALAFAATSIFHEAQHVLIDRDPGAYLNTGRWLAGHSGLVFRADVGAFRGTPGLAYDSPAVNDLSKYFFASLDKYSRKYEQSTNYREQVASRQTNAPINDDVVTGDRSDFTGLAK